MKKQLKQKWMPVFIYLLTWLLSYAVSFLMDPGDAMAYWIIFFWLVLPLSAVITAIIIGKNDSFSRVALLFLACFYGLAYMMIHTVTFWRSKMFEYPIWENPYLETILYGALFFVVGVVIGKISKNMRNKQSNTCGYVIKTKEDDAIVQNRAKIRAEIERNIVPCAKTKEEFRSYLVDTLGMKEVQISEFELRDAKVQFIFKLCPELLRTPMCSAKEDRNAALQSLIDRRKEAQNISLEQTGFEITKYAMEYYMDDYKLSDVAVFLEENSFTYYASVESYVRNDEDDRIARHLFDNIILFRGVTVEDIKTKSEWYGAYVSLLTSHAMEDARRKGQ